MATYSSPLRHRKSIPQFMNHSIPGQRILQTPELYCIFQARRKSLPESFKTKLDPTWIAQPAESECSDTKPRTQALSIVEWGTIESVVPKQDRYNGVAADAPPLDENQLSKIDCEFCQKPMAQGRWRIEREAEDSGNTWQYYTRPFYESCKELFHGACTSCECSDQSEAAMDLCEFCSHLRLRHLFSCMPETFVMWLSDTYTGDELETDQRNCSFCRLVANAREMHWPYIERGVFPLMRLPHGIGNLDFNSEYMQNHPITLQHYDPPIFVDSSAPAESKQAALGDYHTFHKELINDQSWALARAWIEDCCSSHSECSIEKSTSEIPHFRLIDVQERRLVKASIFDSFVALSYVWGTDRNPSWIQTTLSTINELESEGALDASRLPQTVEDAIRACDKLEERYLWVDQLCIVQDDLDNKEHHIGRMGSVYTLAKLVMIDCTGNSMNDGLAGMNRERYIPPDTMVIDGMRFYFAADDRRKILQGSTWDSRGWTFQEAVLARRKLYFTKTQMCFECKHHNRHENRLTDTYIMANHTKHGALAFSSLNVHKDLQYLLMQYRDRHLTNESDACYAFSGILEASQGAGNFIYGHPLANFDEWLLWFPANGGFGSRESILNQPSDGTVFPSWSWSHMLGSVYFSDYESFCVPLVSWAYGTTGGWRHIRASSAHGIRREWRLAAAIAWDNGCILTRSQLPAITSMDYENYSSLLEKRWPRFEDFWDEAYGTWPSTALDETARPDGSPHPGQLLTVAQSAKFGLDFGCHTAGDLRLSITNERREIVGTLYGSDPRVKRDIFPVMSTTGAKYEFIALSISWLSQGENGGIGFPWQTGHEGKTGMYCFQDSEGVERSEAFQVAVMLIKRTGPVARQVGTGCISLQKWVDAERTWERIILE